jgi:hypothetical protein
MYGKWAEEENERHWKRNEMEVVISMRLTVGGMSNATK